ncbi:unnamed protein product [Urochloa humidicola]
MLGKMVGRVAEAEQRDASFDRGRRTTGNTSVPPPPLLAPPPKLFLADESGVSGVSPPAPVEAAAIMSPTSTLQAAAAASPTSPPPAAVFARHGASSSSSSGGRDDRQRNSSKSRSHHHHHRPAWEAARHTGVGLAGVLNGDAAAATVLTGQSFRSAAFDGADGSAARSSLLMMSPREMEASEGYTRVIARGGPSTRTTHIFDGRVVAVDGEDGGGFLRWCHGCSKDLGQGKDIFMYRGEMAFCSHECRYREMLLFGEES